VPEPSDDMPTLLRLALPSPPASEAALELIQNGCLHGGQQELEILGASTVVRLQVRVNGHFLYAEGISQFVVLLAALGPLQLGRKEGDLLGLITAFGFVVHQGLVFRFARNGKSIDRYQSGRLRLGGLRIKRIIYYR